MPVRRVYTAFTTALKVRGFILESNIATSSDGKIVIEFAGEVWILRVAGEFVIEHPMVAGSMADLERTLKTYDTVLNASKKLPRKKSSKKKIQNRFDIRKANQEAGLNRTIEHRELDKYKTQQEHVMSATKMIFLATIQTSLGFEEVGGEIKTGNYTLKFPDTESVWELYHYDRRVGEGICSKQSVSVIDTIINDSEVL